MEVAIWFRRFSERKFFHRMGYTSLYAEILDDEAEWFLAIENEIQSVSEKLRKHGNKKV